MNERQKRYFRAKLLAWKQAILAGTKKTIQQLAEDNEHCQNAIDRAASETKHIADLRTNEHQSELLRKIDKALDKIEQSTYGYCEETGEPIAVQRLCARPIATLSIEAQRAKELKEKLHWR